MNSYDQLQSKLANVSDILCSILKEKLDNYGIYYRMVARVKTGDSIRQKLSLERYQKDPEKKINDLFGVRIMVYYQDDIGVCQKILENMLVNLRWKASENDSNTFDAMKNNGIFVLPGFVQKIVLPEIEGLRINPNFEIQLRTVFFEGWHEAEHDMRYKDIELWDDFSKESRKLNSILATLEMCDQYMVSLFDDMGHDFYKNRIWGQMIRYRYRLRTLNGELNESLSNLITTDLGKKIFKWSKKDLVQDALDKGMPTLDADTIIYLVNERLEGTSKYNPKVREEYWSLRRSKPKTDFGKEKQIAALHDKIAFGVNLEIHLAGKSLQEQFDEILYLVYTVWFKKDLDEIFPGEFDGPVHPVKRKTQGTSCRLKYDPESCYLFAQMSYLGLDAPGKLWTIQLEVKKDEENHLNLRCKNVFSEPNNAPTTVLPYNRPKIYSSIGKVVNLKDVEILTGRLQNIKTIGVDRFFSLVESDARKMPVLLITVPNEERRTNSTSRYGRLVDYVNNQRDPERNNLMRKVGYVCHAYYAMGEDAAAIAKRLGENPDDYINGLRYWGMTSEQKDESYFSYSQKAIDEKPRDLYALRNKEPFFYQSVSGADAVRHEIIQMVYQHVLLRAEENILVEE